MKQAFTEFAVSSRVRGLHAFTPQVARWVDSSGIVDGLLTLVVRHTSASLLIQENYDPDVQSDLERFFSRLVKDGDPMFAHSLEGPDDMPAHVRAALTQTHLSIPVQQGAMMLGRWQGIYLYEHRYAPQQRRVAAHLMGDGTS